MAQMDSIQDRSPVKVSAQTNTTHNGQYTLARIIGLWAVAALPMAFLAWVVTPALITRVKQPPTIVFWLMIIVGMVWQFALSLWIVYREEGNLHWSTVRRRAWLNAPRNPRTGEPQARLFWWLLPCLFIAFISLGLGILLANSLTFRLVFHQLLRLPFYLPFSLPSYTNVTELASPEFAGQWWLLGVALLSWALTAFFAEEFLFRGVLLPKMAGVFGKWDWVANAVLFGLYYLHKPWMIPFRLIDAMVIAWPARRFRSNWMAIIVHGAEGVVLIALVVSGVMSSPLAPLPMSLTFPHIDRGPAPANWYRGSMTSVPTYDPDSDDNWQVDLRSYDLSSLDLRGSYDDLLYADFDSRTIWPPEDQMPQGFDPERILELGKNPGLGVTNLHAQGITGRGVGIAIIDQPLLTEHQEYADQLRWYEEIGGAGTIPASMHGPAVASLAVGKTVGVAPEADLYYIVDAGGLSSAFLWHHYTAQGIRRILQINEQLPEAQKIRVISISSGWVPNMSGYYDIMAAVQEAKEKGILVVCSSIEQVHGFKFHGLGRFPLADPDVFEVYEPGMFWADRFYGAGGFSDRLLVSMDSRATASPTGTDEYVFYRQGGWSWSIPYIAGVYALAVQVDPAITPVQFWTLALETGRTIDLGHDGQTISLGPIIDPVALVNALRNE